MEKKRRRRPARTRRPKENIGQPVGSCPGTSSYSSAFSLHSALHGSGFSIGPANEAKQANELNAYRELGVPVRNIYYYYPI
jgi:hypothetical protein